MTSFCVVYTGNVGSSALVSYAKGANDVFVPIYEELDSYKWDQSSSTYREYYRKIFKSVVMPGLGTQGFPEECNSNVSDIRKSIDKYKNELITGFKWRPFFSDSFGEKDAREIFEEAGTQAVLPFRQSIMSHGLRMFFTRSYCSRYFNPEDVAMVTNGSQLRHLQFFFTRDKMGDDEYQTHLPRFESHTFRLKGDEIQELEEEIESIYWTTKKLIDVLDIFSKPLWLIKAEDITSGAQSATYEILRNLGYQQSEQINAPQIEFRKAGMKSISQCENIQELESSEKIRRYMGEYERLIGEEISKGRLIEPKAIN